MQANTITLSFVAGKNFCQIDMAKNNNNFFVKEIKIFEDNNIYFSIGEFFIATRLNSFFIPSFVLSITYAS